MIISILFDNKLYPLEVHPYQSFHSILNTFHEDYSPQDFYFSFHSKIIQDFDSCCDAHDIPNHSVIELHPRLKGGGFSDFVSFFKKHYFIVIFGLLIALIPLLTLPGGLIPITASLLKVVLDESFEKIGVYLATNLGKYTLYKRLKTIINFIKFFVFILIVYVSITFPLLILTSIMKGQDVLGDPKSICSPSNAAFITGLILTTLYMVI